MKCWYWDVSRLWSPTPTLHPHPPAPTRHSDIIGVNLRTSGVLRNAMWLLQWVGLLSHNETSDWLTCYHQLVSTLGTDPLCQAFGTVKVTGKASKIQAKIVGCANYPKDIFIWYCLSFGQTRLQWVNGDHTDPVNHQLPHVSATARCRFPKTSGISLLLHV